MNDENMSDKRVEPDERAIQLDDTELDEAAGGRRMHVSVRGKRSPADNPKGRRNLADNSKGKKCLDCGMSYSAVLTRCPLCGSKESDTIQFR